MKTQLTKLASQLEEVLNTKGDASPESKELVAQIKETASGTDYKVQALKDMDTEKWTVLLKQEKAELKQYKTYTLTELEPVLGVSHMTLLRWINNGTLKAVKVGGKWKVTEDAIKEAISGK